MNPDMIGSFALGAALGGALIYWRTWVFIRKLRHFGVDLDRWALYKERERQAEAPILPFEPRLTHAREGE